MSDKAKEHLSIELLPQIKQTDFSPTGKEAIHGRDHIINKVNYEGAEVVFRQIQRESTRDTSIEETEAALELALRMNEINSKMAEQDLPVRFEAHAPIAIVRDTVGDYIGALYPLIKPTEEEKPLYPQMLYNQGIGLGYKLTIDRWQELRECESKKSLEDKIQQYLQNDSTELEKVKALKEEYLKQELEISRELGSETDRIWQKQRAIRKGLESDPEIAKLEQNLRDLETELGTMADASIRTAASEPGGTEHQLSAILIIEEARRTWLDAIRKAAEQTQEYQELEREIRAAEVKAADKMQELNQRIGSDSSELYSKEYGYEIFEELAESILHRIREKTDTDAQTLLDSHEGRISDLTKSYEDTIVGKGIFQALNILYQEGFQADIQGSSNLIGHTEQTQEGKELCIIRLFDVSKVKK